MGEWLEPLILPAAQPLQHPPQAAHGHPADLKSIKRHCAPRGSVFLIQSLLLSYTCRSSHVAQPVSWDCEWAKITVAEAVGGGVGLEAALGECNEQTGFVFQIATLLVDLYNIIPSLTKSSSVHPNFILFNILSQTLEFYRNSQCYFSIILTFIQNSTFK